MSMLRATRSRVLLFLAGGLLAAAPAGPDAVAFETGGTGAGVVRGRDGALRLDLSAGAAPEAFGSWERYGLWDSEPAQLGGVFGAVDVRYRVAAPAGTEYHLAVRGSADGRRWTQWEWDIAAGGRVNFPAGMRWIQHRVVLLAEGVPTPQVSGVELTPLPLMPAGGLAAAQQGVAPTYRLRITRQGMVGGRTANGHVIKPRDFFIALPSWKVLSTRKGQEYLVRLSANGKSVVVPVMDVGPWNRYDNYWDANRERYDDLPVGWPQDHAAFFEDYNNRRSEKGYVRYPSAADVADGAYWALGLKGAQATVDVTFLWLGSDPGPSPPPLNDKPSRRPEVPAP